ncbi:PDZ domain-containing protein [Pseudomarimonas salicorniae]|uniref:PDZ domain-containing protein n=1 Tax=Pseudomarimonas salicorniae TaxID=2933270 RepID=UPI00249F4254|nr:PDZ domain-containing protein [Lysobacter sp. CAU 1642]
MTTRPTRPTLLSLALAGLLASPAVSAQSAGPDAARAERESRRAEAAAERDAHRAIHAADRERAATDRERARAELQASQRELAEVAARVARLSAQAAGEDMRRALREGALTRPVIGVVLEPDDGPGIAIAAVSPRSPAREAGLRAGDRLVAVDGTVLAGSSPEARLEQATELLRSKQAGHPVDLEVERGGARLRMAVSPRALPVLAALPTEGELSEQLARELTRAALPMARFHIGDHGPLALCPEGEECLAGALLESGRWNGLRLFPLNAELGRYFNSERGVLVLESGKGHPLRPGDVLLSVEGQPVDSPAEAMRRLRGGEGDSRSLRLRRGGREEALQIDALQLDLLPPLPPIAPLPPMPPLPPPPPAAGEDAAGPAPAAPPAAPAGAAAKAPSVLGRVLSR